jgi:hypothetical protein
MDGRPDGVVTGGDRSSSPYKPKGSYKDPPNEDLPGGYRHVILTEDMTDLVTGERHQQGSKVLVVSDADPLLATKNGKNMEDPEFKTNIMARFNDILGTSPQFRNRPMMQHGTDYNGDMAQVKGAGGKYGDPAYAIGRYGWIQEKTKHLDLVLKDLGFSIPPKK